MNIVVLGGGLVGGPMAMDLAADDDIQVTVADIDPGALGRLQRAAGVEVVQQDLADAEAVRALVSGFDMVVSAVPGFMGYRTLEAVIAAGKPVVDIAFCPEDAMALDSLAKARGVTAVVDCGVAPGMTHMLIGYAHHLLDETQSAVIYVGGLPEIRRWPYEYKAVFSPLDVIEEYVRPVFFVENGRVVEREALSDPELVDFPQIGTLEAFNTDGLRSLIKTLDIPHMKEKTLRYPGHIEKMRMLRESGFFSDAAMEVGGVTVRPLDVTARLLFPQWKLEAGEVDVTIMQIIVRGKKDGRSLTYTYDLFDRYDPATGIHSMARTTGYTATVVARLLNSGLFKETGVIPPERIGAHPDCVAFVLEALKARGVVYRETVSEA